MIMTDLYCPKCEEEINDVMVKSGEEITQKCPKCDEVMRKRVAKRMSFELKYDPKKDTCDWQGNKTRYWDDYNAKKAQGLKVRPVNED